MLFFAQHMAPTAPWYQPMAIPQQDIQSWQMVYGDESTEKSSLEQLNRQARPVIYTSLYYCPDDPMEPAHFEPPSYQAVKGIPWTVVVATQPMAVAVQDPMQLQQLQGGALSLDPMHSAHQPSAAVIQQPVPAVANQQQPQVPGATSAPQASAQGSAALPLDLQQTINSLLVGQTLGQIPTTAPQAVQTSVPGSVQLVPAAPSSINHAPASGYAVAHAPAHTTEPGPYPHSAPCVQPQHVAMPAAFNPSHVAADHHAERYPEQRAPAPHRVRERERDKSHERGQRPRERGVRGPGGPPPPPSPPAGGGTRKKVMCNFYNTASGCRRGAGCQFLHIRAGETVDVRDQVRRS